MITPHGNFLIIDNPQPPAHVIIEVFRVVARHFLVTALGEASCIASSRVTEEVLKIFGIQSKAYNTMLRVRCLELKLAYVAGVPKAELATAKEVIDLHTGEGWEGHVVNVIPGRGILDTTLFQVDYRLKTHRGAIMGFAPMIYAWNITDEIYTTSLATLVLLNDQDHRIDLQYQFTDNEGFKNEPAWELEYLKPLIHMIVETMRGELAL